MMLIPHRRSRALALFALGASLAVGIATFSPEFVVAQEGKEQQPMIADVKQLKLSEKDITGFLTAQRGLIAITDKLEKAGDTIDEKLQAELDGIARKGGFANFAQFDDIRANIMMVLAGINPENGSYTDPMELIKKDIEAIKTDASLSAEDRKQQLEELNEALKEMQPLQYKENIPLVQKHFKEIDEVLK
jgi:hypothetical protein